MGPKCNENVIIGNRKGLTETHRNTAKKAP